MARIFEREKPWSSRNAGPRELWKTWLLLPINLEELYCWELRIMARRWVLKGAMPTSSA